jgi:hypothetical protein
MTDTMRRTTTEAAKEATEAIRKEADTYRNGRDLPLEGFVGLMAAYAAFVGAGSVAVRRKGLPERLEWADIALASIATHRLSRLISKDSVTSPIRAPFTRFKDTGGPSELVEEVRGTGPRKAIGELLTCPFCISQWLATGFTFGLVLAPRATRLAATVLTAVTTADFLQFARAAAEQHT